MDAQHPLAQRTGDLIFGQCVNGLHDDRDRGELSVGGCIGEHRVTKFGWRSFFKLNRLGPQHQMRKIKIPGVGRHIRALGHVADVAEVALVDHLPVFFLRHAIHLTGRALINQIKEPRKRIAEAHATAAAMADVENPFHFCKAGGLVVKLLALPVNGMPGRRL